MLRHRPPTRFDIGKTVEVIDAQGNWTKRTLTSIHQYGVTASNGVYVLGYADCRVPYTTSDPIAELSAAADWLAERGCDEAARVLLQESVLRQCVKPSTGR